MRIQNLSKTLDIKQVLVIFEHNQEAGRNRFSGSLV